MNQGKLGGQQVLLLPEGSSRVLGRDAQSANIAVAYAVSRAIKSTLGPRGMDKMMVDELGDITITNDGATILKEMHVEHPAAKMMVEIAKTQDEEVGDGTTTSVIIAGEILKKAAELLDQDIHASTINRGYRQATAKAMEILSSSATKVKPDDKQKLETLATIAMGSKAVGSGDVKNHLAKIVVDSLVLVSEKRDGRVFIDKDYVKIEKKQGGDAGETQLVSGVLIDKEIVHSGMPKEIKGATIALVDAAIEISKTETDARINISSPEQLQAFLEQEEKMLKNMVEKIKATGATALFCQKGIDDVAQHFLSKAGIVAVRRVKKSDMEKIAKATGAVIVTTLDDLSAKDLGFAGKIEEKKIAGEEMIFIENCREPKSVTIFIRGGTPHVIDEAERAVVDAIGAVSSAMEDGLYVVGGGAIEMELAIQLRKHAATIGGREQLAIEAYAEALESIPRTLAESCGMDVINALVELRSRHEKGEKNVGVDVLNEKLGPLPNVIEPAKTKKQALASASEVTEMILRIDDIIASRGKPAMPSGPEGMGGMGGMGMD